MTEKPTHPSSLPLSIKQAVRQLAQQFETVNHTEPSSKEQFYEQGTDTLTKAFISQLSNQNAATEEQHNSMAAKRRKAHSNPTPTKRRKTRTQTHDNQANDQHNTEKKHKPSDSQTKQNQSLSATEKTKAKTDNPTKKKIKTKKNDEPTSSKDVNRNQSLEKLPWWRRIDARLVQSHRSQIPNQIMKGFIMAVIRSSIRESWSSDNLLKSYTNDPSSSRGKAFQVVSQSMLLMERARHMGQCHKIWQSNLINELTQRREIEWRQIQVDRNFDHFAGCDVCLGHRQATIRLLLKGARYNSADYWPKSMRPEVLSSDNKNDGSTIVAVEVSNSGREDSEFSNTDDDSEFWVDEQCLRKCLVFHELSHSTSILVLDVRSLIENELRNGFVKLDNSERRQSLDGNLIEKVEGHLVNALSKNEEFITRRTTHLTEILQLGDLYFSAANMKPRSEQDGSVKKMNQVYDPPIQLDDDQYSARIDNLLKLTQKLERDASFATFF